jgi:hypothetical protein
VRALWAHLTRCNPAPILIIAEVCIDLTFCVRPTTGPHRRRKGLGICLAAKDRKSTRCLVNGASCVCAKDGSAAAVVCALWAGFTRCDAFGVGVLAEPIVAAVDCVRLAGSIRRSEVDVAQTHAANGTRRVQWRRSCRWCNGRGSRGTGGGCNGWCRGRSARWRLRRTL